MLKNPLPIRFGEYHLDLAAPVKFTGDYRNGLLEIHPGYALQTDKGVLIGEVDLTETPPQFNEFPMSPAPLQFPYRTTDPELQACWDALGAALHRFLAYGARCLKARPDLTGQTFRIGGVKYRFDYDAHDYDAVRDRPYVEVVEPPPAVLPPEDMVEVTGLELPEGLALGVPKNSALGRRAAGGLTLGHPIPLPDHAPAPPVAAPEGDAP
jgi:hypothetical protein